MLLILIFSKKKIIKLVRLTANIIFDCQNPKDIEFLTGLRLGLSHLHEHEITSKIHWVHFVLVAAMLKVQFHLLLHCPSFLAKRNTLLSKITNLGEN